MFKDPFSKSFSQIFSQETVNLTNVAASVLLLIIILSFILIILESFTCSPRKSASLSVQICF